MSFVPGVGIFAASIIGSAIGAAVNGGTFKSFAIGVGIGIAAGVVANGIGGYFGGGVKAFTDWQARIYSVALLQAPSPALSPEASPPPFTAVTGGKTCSKELWAVQLVPELV